MNQLCATFQLLAKKVWHDRDDGVRCGLDPSEETITEVLLLELARRHPSDVVVRKFTRHEEGKQYGADWEWWFVGGGLAWGTRVQAKKLDGRLRNYRGIDYPYGRKRRQITRFLSASQSDRLYPLYCFYNLPDQRLLGAGAGCPLAGSDASLLGCTIADGRRISRQRQKRLWEVTDIAPLLMPWHCLVCCPHAIATSTGGSIVPNGIHNWVTERLAGKPSMDDELAPVRSLSDAPRYVRRAYEMRGQRPGIQDDLDYDGEDREISGFVLFRMSSWLPSG